MTTAETTTAVARRDEQTELAPMTPDSLNHQVQLIQHVMHKVMKKDTHYGVIPGCGDKPTLLKPGAEKLGMTFQFHPQFEIERHDLQGGHREYEITCRLFDRHGNNVGEGLGVCSTMESKYRWRKGELTCPECGGGPVNKDKKGSGGWYCWRKKGGCGAQFGPDDKRIKDQDVGRVENPDPADCYNTVKKIAKKRAHVDAILTATAASDIFAQDLEDLPRDTPPQNPPQPPQNDPEPDVAGDDQVESIRAEIERSGADEAKMLDWASKTLGRQVGRVEDLPPHIANQLLQMLQKKPDAQPSGAQSEPGEDQGEGVEGA